MNESIEKLGKFLRLEEERGYDNRAVLGGLENMLDPWEEQARSSGIDNAIIELVASRLGDYARLSEQSRAETLDGLWYRLQSEYPEIVELRSPTSGMPDTPYPDSATSTSEALGISEEIPQPPKGSEPAEPKTESSPRSSGAGDTEAVQTETTPTDATTSPPSESEAPAAFNAPLTTIPGIGPKSAKTLEKLGLFTLGDLLYYLPRRYDDYSQLKTINRLWYGEDVTIIGTVEDIKVRAVQQGKLKLVEAVISDGTDSIRVTWFNQVWIANRLKPGRPIVLSGRVDQYLGRLTMNSPEWEPLEKQQLHTNRIVPVYPLTAGVTSKWLRKVTDSVVSRLAPRVVDPLPESVQTSNQLISLSEALKNIHFPTSWEALEQAQQRLAFDEMLLLQLGVLRQKANWEKLEAEPLVVPDHWIEHFLEALPYRLTAAQERALADIREDLARPAPMNRLLQGDVGSGKTIIAAAAMGMTSSSGAQSAVMAPTSILADQHFKTLSQLLPTAAGIQPSEIRLLLGATPEAEKAEIRNGLETGEVKIVIGTHALLEDPVEFRELGLVIIDEQHRFGVEQRATLRGKGSNPNLLVMTATPIPRSLALTLYGDLDLTVMDEMPPGRQPIETRVLHPIERSRGHNFIRSQLEINRQAFIVYPLVEGSDKIQAKAAVDEYEFIQKDIFPNRQVGLLHGRMSQDEKESTMAAFRSGEFEVLVSTSVIEVGVDIPNASVIMVEGANRFGLSQLHQFRGRVGRSEYDSYCLLIPDSDDQTENERLLAMESTQDGFKLAEIDLEQRGPGDFLGTRQSGFAELKAARLTDVRLIEKARNAAYGIFEQDPNLEKAEHQQLSNRMDQFWSTGKGEIS